MSRRARAQAPSPRERGFSLFESVVALAVFALAAMSSLQLITQNVDAVARLEARAVAGYVAQNVMVETRLETVLKTSATTGKAEMGSYAFEWERVVTETGEGNLRRVTVKVKRAGDTQILSELDGFWHD